MSFSSHQENYDIVWKILRVRLFTWLDWSKRSLDTSTKQVWPLKQCCGMSFASHQEIRNRELEIKEMKKGSSHLFCDQICGFFYVKRHAFANFIYWTWIWHVRSSVFFSIVLKKIHGYSHSEEEERRWLNGGTSTKKSYIWLLEDQLEDHSLYGIWGQCWQQVINKGCLVFAKTSTKPSYIGLTITMDPSDESAGSLEDLEWRTWKVYFRELNYFSFTHKIVLISCYYLMNTRLICVVFVDLARGKGVEQGLRWLGSVVSVLQDKSID